ncbi:MAG TPA: PilW family protein [Ramlibacter sp.]|nr:PilW family protein [Ramlibacter sp.]
MNTRHISSLQRRQQRGVTLIELMVGITVGMLVVAAMALLFANNSRTRLETERAGVKIDNGRYALDVLGRDLQHAGYLAEFNPNVLTLPASKPGACELDVATLGAALPVPVLGYDNVTTAMLAGTALSCLQDVVPGTDIVVIRRVATCTNSEAGCTMPGNGAPVFQASSCNSTSELGGIVVANHYKFAAYPSVAFNLHVRDCTTTASLRRYIVRIYYVANNDKTVNGVPDGIPTLKRLEMSPTGTWDQANAISLAPGVENFQVEWGVDTNTDGVPDLYATDPDKYCATAATVVPSGTCWSLPVAAKMFVMARNVDASPGHTDTKTYAMGKTGDATTGISGTADFTAGPFNNSFKRNVYQRSAAMQNVSSRRFSP